MTNAIRIFSKNFDRQNMIIDGQLEETRSSPVLLNYIISN